MSLPLLPTSLVGSYAQPEWLIDRAKLAGRFPPRVRAKELWRIPPEHLAEAQDDATLRRDPRAGGGRARHPHRRRDPPRELLQPLRHRARRRRHRQPGHGARPQRPPQPGAPGRRPDPRGRTRWRSTTCGSCAPTPTARSRSPCPGPFTMSQQAQNDHYPDAESAAMGYADAVNAEIKDLFAAGADIVQIDEPYLQARPDAARAYGLAALNPALDGVSGTTAVHLCFGYAAIIHERPAGYSFLPELADCTAATRSRSRPRSPGSTSACSPTSTDKTIILGVLDLSTPEVETVDTVAARARRAFDHLPPEQLVLAPDCGMKYLPRDAAFGKMRAMVGAARVLRDELGR